MCEKISKLEELRIELKLARKNKDHKLAIDLHSQIDRLHIEIYGPMKKGGYGSRAGKLQYQLRSAR